MATLYHRVSSASTLPRASVLSLDVSLISYKAIQEAIIAAAHRHESRTVCFANVHMTIEGKQDPTFARVVNEADWVAADGVPLTWAVRLLYKQHLERATGLDLLPDLVRRADQEQLPIFFYGSTPDILRKMVAVCCERHPTIRIAGTLSPPFRPLTETEEQEVVGTINESGARLVFVALGCPKQERWISAMRGRVQAVMLGIGGALPVMAGVQQRAPHWVQRVGLEWAFRLAVEPRRLFKRYAVTNSLFLLYLTRQFWRTKRGADSRRQHQL